MCFSLFLKFDQVHRKKFHMASVDHGIFFGGKKYWKLFIQAACFSKNSNKKNLSKIQWFIRRFFFFSFVKIVGPNRPMTVRRTSFNGIGPPVTSSLTWTTWVGPTPSHTVLPISYYFYVHPVNSKYDCISRLFQLLRHVERDCHL